MVAVTASPSQQLIGLTEMEENRTDIKRFFAPVSSGFFSPFLLLNFILRLWHLYFDQKGADGSQRCCMHGRLLKLYLLFFSSVGLEPSIVFSTSSALREKCKKVLDIRPKGSIAIC